MKIVTIYVENFQKFIQILFISILYAAKNFYNLHRLRTDLLFGAKAGWLKRQKLALV